MIFTPTDREAEYWDDHVCLCLPEIIPLELHVPSSPSYVCILWPWLGRPLVAQWYVMYFQFFGWNLICTQAKAARRLRPTGLHYKWRIGTPTAGNKCMRLIHAVRPTRPQWGALNIHDIMFAHNVPENKQHENDMLKVTPLVAVCSLWLPCSRLQPIII